MSKYRAQGRYRSCKIKVYPMSRTTWTFYLELREAT